MTGPAPTMQSGNVLLSVGDLKDYIRIEHNKADGELALLVEEVQAILEGELLRPLVSRVITVQDRALNRRVGYGQVDVDARTPVRALMIGTTPVSQNADDVQVVDKDGTTVDPTTYWVEYETGMIRPMDGNTFSMGPYVITAAVGLEYRDEYEQVILPAIKRVLMELCADMYQRKSPGATQESQGGGRGTQYTDKMYPPRTEAFIQQWRAVSV